jgi:hypothetical protein
MSILLPAGSDPYFNGTSCISSKRTCLIVKTAARKVEGFGEYDTKLRWNPTKHSLVEMCFDVDDFYQNRLNNSRAVFSKLWICRKRKRPPNHPVCHLSNLAAIFSLQGF